MGWEDRMVEATARDAARQVFDDWLAMRVQTSDVILGYDRQNDVAQVTFDLRNDDRHVVRDFLATYNQPGRTPIRVIGLDDGGDGKLVVDVLLAELDGGDD